jgi:hypothetical protein
MTTLPRFPDLPGLSWPVKRTPKGGATRIFRAASGRTARLALWRYPLFEFELTFDGLASNDAYPGLFACSKQMLEGFLLQMQGSAGLFAFEDKTDAYQSGAALGLGDGTTTSFTAQRDIGGFRGPADYVLNVGAVYVNGTAVSNWTLSLPNSIVFASAPAAGAVITADFWWAYACAFKDDSFDLEQFMSHLWEVKSLKFESVRPS